MIEEDSVSLTTLVAAPPELAFEIFTQETDLWWGKGPRFRPLSHPQGRMIFEGKVGGRLLEHVDDSERPEVDSTPDFVLGRIQVWDPPSRLVFAMGGRDFAPADGAPSDRSKDTEDWPIVDITFEAVSEGTRVHLVHRGFARLAADHPVRHDLDPTSFLDIMGIFWADLLAAVQRHTNTSSIAESA